VAPHQEQLAPTRALQDRLKELGKAKLSRAEQVKARTAAKRLRDERIAARETYRLRAKGRPRDDGRQQYFLPDEHEILTADGHRAKTVMFPPAEVLTAGKSGSGTKFQQRYPYKSPTWKRWYGLRSTVEHANAHLKDPSHENMGEPGLRRGRGYAYQYLMAALMSVSSNLRKIWTFINRLEAQRDPTSPYRLKNSARASRQAQEDRWLLKPPLDGRTTRFPKKD